MIETFATIDDVVGSGTIPYAYIDGATTTSSTSGFNHSSATIHDTTNGVTLANTTWRYVPSDGWSAVGENRVFVFRAKAVDTANLQLYVCNPSSSSTSDTYDLFISPTGLSTSTSATVNYSSGFVPGYDFVDYLMKDNNGGFLLYAKEATLNKWIKVLDVTGGGSISSKAGFYFGGCGYVREATIYNTGITKYATIKDIVGSDVVTTYDFAFGTGFNATMNGGALLAGEPSFDANGMGLYNAGWRFYKASGAGYSPLANDNVANFKLKLTDSDDQITVKMKSPLDATNAVHLEVKSTGVDVYGVSIVTPQFNYAPNDDEAEYVVKANGDNGYDVYIKAPATGDKFVLYASTTAYNNENGSTNTGFRFYGNATCNGYVNDARVYTTANIVAEDATKPADATTLYFGEEYETMPSIHNVGVSGMTATDGNLAVDVANGKITGNYYILNTEIPEDGYAEFRTKGSSVNRLYFYDGESSFQLSFNGGVTSVNGTGVEVSDGGTTWRTWRVVRNTTGTYNGYCKLGGESWYQVFTNVDATANETQAQFKIEAYAADIEYDYLKIYGPQNDATLILTDGVSTEVVADGDAITYDAALRAIVNAESGKLLVVNYSGNDMIGAQIVNVADIDEIGQRFNVRDSSCDKVKVFLWDGFEKLTPMTDVITLIPVK